MKKVFPVDVIRELDAYTIEHEPVSSADLMERAGLACANWIEEYFGTPQNTAIVAGPGNNGGDGLVIGRLLASRGWPVTVLVPVFAGSPSDDFAINLERLHGTGVKKVVVAEEADLDSLPPYDLLIDALFGSGLSRPVNGVAGRLIEWVNSNHGTVVSIDIPSGLYADRYTDPALGAIVKADMTLSVELPKLCMLMPSCHQYTGVWCTIPIMLDPGFIADTCTDVFVTEESDIRALFKPRDRVGHKGNYGHALLLAGSRERGGAALLSATAALRSGAGLLTAAVPGCLATPFNAALPEAMLIPGPPADHLDTLPDIAPYTAIAAGPGMGTLHGTQHLIHQLLTECRVPLVLDADALNILAINQEWLSLLSPRTILTPHPGEFSRLAGESFNDFGRLAKAQAFARHHQCYLILKSAFTAVITPDGVAHFNTRGNGALAKGGSGDTLTGILLGLLARGYPTTEAALLAVYLHAVAAEKVAETNGLDTILASDITKALGVVMKQLENG